MAKARVGIAVLISLGIVGVFVGAILALGGHARADLFGGKVGVVEVVGIIEQSGPTMETLDRFARDEAIKAVVLRVNSPGGGVGPSQEIHAEVKRLALKKPVVCSMGAVAASGGLYVAVPSTKIVANPGTITGSIGIISTIPDMEGLFKKIGVRMQVVKSGKLKGFGQVDRPLNDAERQMLQELSTDLYRQFVEAVAQGRGLKVEAVEAMADGGVFSGRRAQSLGLVDRMGNFMDAVALAAKLGGITGRPQIVTPEDDSMQGWLRRMVEESGRALVAALRGASATASLPGYLYQPAAERP